jgi:hypothetical protein
MYCIDSYSRISREDHQIDALSGKLGLSKREYHNRLFGRQQFDCLSRGELWMENFLGDIGNGSYLF